MSQDPGEPETPSSQIYRESKESEESKSSKKHRHREESGEKKRSKKHHKPDDSQENKSSKKSHKSQDSPEKEKSKKHHDSQDRSDERRSKKHHKSHNSQEKEKSKKRRRDSQDSQEKRSSKKRKRHDDTVASLTPDATSPDHQNKRPRLETIDNDEEPSIAGAPEPLTNGLDANSIDSPANDDEAVKAPGKSQRKRRRVDGPGHNQEPQAALTNSADSPFFTQTTSFYLPISPVAQSSPLHGLCAEHLSPLILTYSRPLDGVILSYSNPRFSSQPPTQHGEDRVVLSRAIDEYGVTYVWLTADFVVLRPEKDTWIKGYISVQSESHIGLVCWNLFNASIERDKLPKEWSWVGGAQEKSTSKGGHGFKKTGRNHADGAGYWVDGDGNAIDGPVTFRVMSFESLPAFGRDKNFMSIEGTLLSKKEEEETQPGPEEHAGQAAQERRRDKHATAREPS